MAVHSRTSFDSRNELKWSFGITGESAGVRACTNEVFRMTSEAFFAKIRTYTDLSQEAEKA